jgi:hypothetical protein
MLLGMRRCGLREALKDSPNANRPLEFAFAMSRVPRRSEIDPQLYAEATEAARRNGPELRERIADIVRRALDGKVRKPPRSLDIQPERKARA